LPLHLSGTLLKPLGLFAEMPSLFAQPLRHFSLPLPPEAVHVTAQAIGMLPVPAGETVCAQFMHPNKTIGIDLHPDDAFEAVGIDLPTEPPFQTV